MNRLFLMTLLIMASGLSALGQPAKNDQPGNLVDTLKRERNFKTLLTALNKSGLTETLKGKGPFTIFAPNDQAFAKLAPGVLKALMQDPARLKSFLLYHVTAGTLSIKDLRSRTDKSITMMDGSKADILDNGFDWPGAQPQKQILNPAFPPGSAEARDDRLRSAGPPKSEIQDNGLSPANSATKATIQDNGFSPAPVVINKSAKVIAGDIAASNGMIHVVDTVLSKDHLQPF